MKNYMEKVNEAKNECLERMQDEVTSLQYGSTEQKIADTLYQELYYNLNDIADPEEYFIKLKSIFEPFENIMNEYHEKLNEIEEETDNED